MLSPTPTLRPLSQALLFISGILFYAAIQTSSRKDEEINSLINTIYNYTNFADRLKYRFAQSIQEKARQIVDNQFPAISRAESKVVDDNGFLTLFEWDRYSFASILGSKPRYDLYIPFEPTESPTLGRAIDIITIHGKENAVVNIVDYKSLMDKIYNELKAYKRRRDIFSCIIHVSTSRKASNTISNPESYLNDLKEMKVDYYLKFTPRKDNSEKSVFINYNHFQIPNSSFADYMVYANANKYGNEIDYQKLKDQISENIVELEKYRLDYVSVAETKSKPANDESFEIRGVAVKYKHFFWIFPLLIISITYWIFYQCKSFLISRNEEYSLPSVIDNNQKLTLEQLAPLPLHKTLVSQKWVLWGYIFIIPAASMVIAIFQGFHKFPLWIIGFYLLAIIICFFISNKISKYLYN